MSDTRIVSGTGLKFVARVDPNNRLVTSSNSQTEEHFISSSEGLSFFANTTDTADTLTTTATGGAMLFLKNDHPSKQLIIARVIASTDTAGGVMTWIRNPTLGTIGNNNIHTPPNLNFGTSVTPIGTFYSWNEVGDGMTGLSGGTKVKSFILSAGSTFFPIESAMVLEKADSLQLNFAGASEFECGVRMFYMDKEV